jgi:Tol biopolymer transport system component
VVSSDGSVVAFSSAASNLVDGAYDYNPVPWDYFDWPEWRNYMDEPHWKVYAYDFGSGKTEPVSRPIQPDEPPFGTSFTSISSDGSLLAFASDTDNFVTDPENGLTDIFLYDTKAKTYRRIAQPPVQGFTRRHVYPEMSEDGTRISYMSRFTDLRTGDERADAFVYDIPTDSHIQVNLTQQGLPADGGCLGTSDLNPSGQFVVISCISQDLVVGDTNGRIDVYVSNLATGLVRRVSVRSDGTEAIGGSSLGGTISADGSKVAFYSDATNLVDGDFNGQRDVFLHDLVSGSTTRISESEAGDSNDRSTTPRISPDGNLVLFMSEATNLTADATLAGVKNVFLHDVASGTNTLLTRGFDGSPADSWSGLAEFSTDGKFIFYSSAASNIVPGDVNGRMDIFLYELATGETKRLSQLNDGTGGNGDSMWAAISDDAKVIALDSLATNFGWYDTNNSTDIYLKSFLPAEVIQRRFEALPDVNGNGIPDVAALVPGSTNRVEVRDGSTDTLISSIDFGADSVVQMESLPDLNSSGRPEIAVLQQQASGQVRVQIRDSLSGNVVRNLFYGNQYTATAMHVLDDYNASGSPEIAVMGSDDTDAIRVQVQDAGSGAILDNVFLGNQGLGKEQQRARSRHPQCPQGQRPGPHAALGCHGCHLPDQRLVWQQVPAAVDDHDAGYQYQRLGRDCGDGRGSGNTERPCAGA